MGSLFSLTLMIIVFSLASMAHEAQRINSARLLDLSIRDYSFKSYDETFITGTVHTVHLPANFSGIKVATAKFRCGSLQRYGAQVNEFHMGIGVKVQPCAERVMVIAQNLGQNWSFIYYANYDLSGYRIVSPILGLLAYNVGANVNFTNPLELGIQASEQPITIDFSNTSRSANLSSVSPLCASFENDGNLTLRNPVSPYICVATRHGHYGLVVKSPPPATQAKGKISPWKVLLGTTVGAALGLSLLGLLLVAMFVKVKKKAKMAELERMAYEEEALQVSMVGHVIRGAPTAVVSRTLPPFEYGYLPHPN